VRVPAAAPNGRHAKKEMLNAPSGISLLSIIFIVFYGSDLRVAASETGCMRML